MAADLDSPAITGTAVIGHRAKALGMLLQKMRVLMVGFRGKHLDEDTADAMTDGIDAVGTELGAIRDLAMAELQAGAEALEAARGVLKALGADKRITPREPEPAAFEGVYVPEPDRPQYLKDMACPSNVVILASVRRSRPEGGAR